MNNQELLSEFDRQLSNILKKGYAKVAGMSDDEFRDLVLPLKKHIENLELPSVDLDKGTLPFVIVVTSQLVPTVSAMNLVIKDGKEGIVKLFPRETTDFKTTPATQLPKTNVYLLLDIDRGKGTLNVTPSDALSEIAGHGRSPLTIDEGVAIITHFPEFLIKNNCFSLLASRIEGDKRVPAIWINAQKQPNLGWCWNGNPHTWLGSASCAKRLPA